MNARPTVAFDASMYFAYGRMRRPEVVARNCFAAVVSRERVSTTRFEQDSRSQFALWRALRIGEVVRVWSGRWTGTGFAGRSCLIEVTEAPRLIDIRFIDREAWSKTEGWSADFLDVLIQQGKTVGLQVLYRLHTAPEDSQIGLGF